MSCIRLYPDILVAAEIDSIRSFYGDDKPIYVEIGNCIAHQRVYACGIFHAFIGFENWEWNYDHYKYYLESLPQYFTRQIDGSYKVNLDALKDEYVLCLGKLLTQGIYPPDVACCFGIEGDITRKKRIKKV